MAVELAPEIWVDTVSPGHVRDTGMAWRTFRQRKAASQTMEGFGGAFARTDVMTGGVLDAWEALAPAVPVFFSVHGTGSAEAREMLRQRLGVTPYPTMDEAIAAAVAASSPAPEAPT